MSGFRTEYRRDIFRSTQAFVILHFQTTFVSMIFYGKGICIIPWFEVFAKFRNTLFYQRNDIHNLTMDFLNVAITIYDDRFGAGDT